MNRLVIVLSLTILVHFTSAAFSIVLQPATASLPMTKKSAELPVSKVVLYSSGVGYFQRDGQVDGNDEVTLRFKVENINDLLKSMVVQDLDGGQVTTVTYDSRAPLAKALKSFGVDLTQNPGLGALLEQLRGAAVQVTTPAPVRGVILGVEKKRQGVGERQVVEVEYLNLVTYTGLRAIPLEQIQNIELVDARLDTELRQALAVLASGHDTQKKTVRLRFEGSGRRRVRVGYVVAAPVWKTSYRLVLSEASKPFLQGWAIVENTTDEDWTNVRLSLISGRPVSFVMDLYEPLYVERPTVVPELYTSLRPQMYEQDVATEEAGGRRAERERRRRGSRAMLKMGVRSAAPMTAPMPAPSVAPAASRTELNLQSGVAAAAQAAELGELFEYAMHTPVSLRRQKSALLPIVGEEVAAEKLAIYNQSVHAKHPLSGVRLHNSSTLHLMQGPITVFDHGSYAGDARLSDLPPGQDALISYAIDLETEVVPEAAAEQRQLVTASLRKGTLLVTRKAVSEKTYTVKNRDREPRKLLIEHPIRPGWELTAPDQPAERTRSAYRFTLSIEAGKSAQLRVREERPLRQTVRLLNTSAERLGYYLEAKEISDQVKQALQQVVQLRHQLDQTRDQRQRLEKKIDTIAQEQKRLRDNMARLEHSSSLYQRYVRKLDQQETEIEKARQEIARLAETEAEQHQALQEFLLSLDIE